MAIVGFRREGLQIEHCIVAQIPTKKG